MDHHHLSARISSRSAHQLVRRGTDSSPTIIIAVVVSIAGLLALLILWRIILHRRQRRLANPLPPVQPLSHIREHQLAAFSAEPKADHYSWVRSIHGTGSNTSLLANSWNADASPDPDVSASSSLNHEPLSISDDLPLPQPPYLQSEASVHERAFGHGRNNSTSSVASSIEPSLPGPSVLPVTQALSKSTSSVPLPRSISRTSRSQSRSRVTSRAYSSYSLASTDMSGRASRTRVLSGIPHAPGNNVQIVLPKPLAPESYPYESIRDEIGGSNINARRSVLLPEGDADSVYRGLSDRWVSVANFESMASMSTVAGGELRPIMNRVHTRSRSGKSQFQLNSFLFILRSSLVPQADIHVYFYSRDPPIRRRRHPSGTTPPPYAFQPSSLPPALRLHSQSSLPAAAGRFRQHARSARSLTLPGPGPAW